MEGRCPIHFLAPVVGKISQSRQPELRLGDGLAEGKMEVIDCSV